MNNQQSNSVNPIQYKDLETASSVRFKSPNVNKKEMNFNSDCMFSNRSNEKIMGNNHVYHNNNDDVYKTSYNSNNSINKEIIDNFNDNNLYNKYDAKKVTDDHHITKDTLDNINTTVGTINSNFNTT